MTENSTKLPQEWTDEEVYQEVGKIVSLFKLFECDKCAKAVIQWLQENKVKGTILKLRTKNRRETYILSDRLGARESITDNGQHYGVEVRERVFDNLSSEGMLREDWLRDFHCESEQFIITELEQL